MEIEEKQKIIKVVVFFAIICILIIVSSFIYTNFIKDGGSKTSDKYLILGNYLILQKTNNGFKQINELNDKILDYKYTITDGQKEETDITLQFLNNKWYFFNKDYSEIEMPNFKVASHNLSVKLADIKQESITNPLDDEYITKFMSDNNITNGRTYRAFVTTYDFDKDGNLEYIYTLSNYSLSAEGYDQKGFIFMVKDDEIINLNNNDGKGPYTVMQIIDLDEDDNYEIIINKGNVDIKTFDSCYQIYKSKENKWELILDCK